MTIGALILTAYIVSQLFNKKKNFQFFLYKLSIIVSMFVNVGFVFKNKTSMSYSTYCMYICVVVFLINCIVFRKNTMYKNSRAMISSILLIFVVVMSYINLINSSNLASVVPFEICIDDVSNGLAYTSIPEFNKNNVGAFRDFVVFCLFCTFSGDFLTDKEKVDDLVKTIERFYKVMFIFLLMEFFVSNFVSNTMMRSIINTIFGVLERTYEVPPQRYGLFNAYGLYVEPSYVAGTMLGYYAIKYVRGINGFKDQCYFLLSVLILIISGSSTGILLISIASIVFIHSNIKLNRRTIILFGISLTVLPIIIVISAVTINNSNKQIFNDIYETTSSKVIAYIHKDQSDKGSGYARMNGNRMCYEVLKTNPFVGVGLGSTRGFGLIPGMVATMGVLGIVAYIFFAKINFNIYINKKNIFLFSIYMALLCYIFSIWYIYMPAIIGIFIGFNKEQGGAINANNKELLV